MINHRFHHKLKAGLLPLTLSICLVLSIFCAASILFAYYNNLLWIGAKTKSRVAMNVDSALKYMLQSNLNGLSLGSEYGLDLFGEGRDSVRFTAKAWGIFDWLRIEAYDGRFVRSKDVIIGYQTQDRSSIALYVSNNSPNSITLVGDARIYGNAWVPQGGIKAGYFDREGYSGTRLIDGEIHASENRLLLFGNDVVIKIQKMIQLLGSVNQGFGRSIPESLSNSFSNSCLTYFSDKSIFVSSHLDGNILIISQSDIIVNYSADLDNVILVAPAIRFSSGFKGCLQAFATREIVLEEGVVLKYPSALVVDSERGGKVDILENCQVNGLILSSCESDTEGLTRIAKSSVVNGQVITTGKCSHQGVINGQLFCKSLVIIDGSGEHLNFLKDGVVNRFGLSGQYLFLGILKEEKERPRVLINL